MRSSGASTDELGDDTDGEYVFPLADTLVLHMHGGGFVAQSSASHETYLKRWAAHLHTPILSIDYTLSPENDDPDEPGAQYPVAVNECFFVYCWALKNARLLGSTAKKVVLVGDSAGANLALAVALKAAATGARRPSAVVACYPPLFISLSCSPSRLLSLLDPMLSLTALELCLAAYRGSNAQDFGEFTRSCGACDDTATDWLLSPATAPDELLKLLPPVYLMAAELDPLLDDSVVFAKRLERLHCDVHYTVIPGVSHGFLNLAVATAETSTTNAACNQCEEWLYTALGKPPRPSSIDDDIRESKRELEEYHNSCSAASREKFEVHRLTTEAVVAGFQAAGARGRVEDGERGEEAQHHREVAGRFAGMARQASKKNRAAPQAP
jgi:acetyl esterase/lipase